MVNKVSVETLETLAENGELIRMRPTREGGPLGKVVKNDEGFIFMDDKCISTPISEGSVIYLGQPTQCRSLSYLITRYVPYKVVSV